MGFLSSLQGFDAFTALRPSSLSSFLLLLLFCLFACSMARGQEKTSTSQAGRKRWTPRELLTESSLVAVMSIEELRSFC